MRPRCFSPASAQAFLHATDGGSGEQLRLATAQVLGPHLHALKLVSQGGGRATSAFLERGSQLQQLTLDFWGAGNVLPRTLSRCTALAVLRVQCSARLGGCGGFAGLRGLRELSVADSDWNRIPPEVAGGRARRGCGAMRGTGLVGWLRLLATAQHASPGCQEHPCESCSSPACTASFPASHP